MAWPHVIPIREAAHDQFKDHENDKQAETRHPDPVFPIFRGRSRERGQEYVSANPRVHGTREEKLCMTKGQVLQKPVQHEDIRI